MDDSELKKEYQAFKENYALHIKTIIDAPDYLKEERIVSALLNAEHGGYMKACKDIMQTIKKEESND